MLVALAVVGVQRPLRPAVAVAKPVVAVRMAGETESASSGDGSAVFVASFSHVKSSLSTFLKFWLMGGCGVDGWSGTGELEAKHMPSGTAASIRVDVEEGTVALVASSAGGNPPLGEYSTALLDELHALASTEEAAPADRLCFPPEAVDSVRLAAWAACATSARRQYQPRD